MAVPLVHAHLWRRTAQPKDASVVRRGICLLLLPASAELACAHAVVRNIRRIASGEETLEPPDTGFFNAGQKVQFWEIVGGCVVYLVTGIILWAGARSFGGTAVAISYVLHDISAIIMLGGIFIHIYLSTIGEPGTFQAMTRGAVSEAWAWTFHPAWYKKVTGRDPREDYEKARQRQNAPPKPNS